METILSRDTSIIRQSGNVPHDILPLSSKRRAITPYLHDLIRHHPEVLPCFVRRKYPEFHHHNSTLWNVSESPDNRTKLVDESIRGRLNPSTHPHHLDKRDAYRGDNHEIERQPARIRNFDDSTPAPGTGKRFRCCFFWTPSPGHMCSSHPS